MDWNSLGTFFTFGVKHVLEGWDHLLFASALVLALRGFWEVFKVIGVFTLAHSITVSLTVVRGAPLLPEWFVEPCIAASIIFVALENIFLPGSAGSVRRLAVAFIFGLVHGMGLAGALLETLSDMSGTVVVWAVVLFCIGVELGHLCVVAPLSGALKMGRDQGGEKFHAAALRYGSIAIAAGGVYYLLASLGLLRGSFGARLVHAGGRLRSDDQMKRSISLGRLMLRSYFKRRPGHQGRAVRWSFRSDGDRLARGGGSVDRIDHLHQAQGLLRGVQGGGTAFDGFDEVRGGADAAHVFTGWSGDAAVHAVAVFLDVEFAGVDGGVVEPIDAEQALHLAAGLGALEDHGDFLAFDHFGPGDLEAQDLTRLEGHEAMRRVFHIGGAARRGQECPTGL